MVRVDIDYMHDDRFINYEKRFKIRMVSKTSSTAVFAGPRENIKRMLVFHYGDTDEAEALHPDVFQNHTRRNRTMPAKKKRSTKKKSSTAKSAARKAKSAAKKVSKLKVRIRKAESRVSKLKTKLAKLK